jgi:hypothetical protein
MRAKEYPIAAGFAQDSKLVLVDYQQRTHARHSRGRSGARQRVRLAKIPGCCRVRCGRPGKPGGWGRTVEPCGPWVAGRVVRKTAFDAVRPAAASGGRRQAAGGKARSLPKHLQKAAPRRPRAAKTIVLRPACEAHVCLLQTALGLRRRKWKSGVTDAAARARAQPRRPFDRLAGAGVRTGDHRDGGLRVDCARRGAA